MTSLKANSEEDEMQQHGQPETPFEEPLPRAIRGSPAPRNNGGHNYDQFVDQRRFEDEPARDWVWLSIYWTYLTVITCMGIIYLRDMYNSPTWYVSFLWIKDAVILLGAMAYIDKWRQRK